MIGRGGAASGLTISLPESVSEAKELLVSIFEFLNNERTQLESPQLQHIHVALVFVSASYRAVDMVRQLLWYHKSQPSHWIACCPT